MFLLVLQDNMIKELYFTQTTGPDAVREDLPFVEREAIVAMVKHPKEDSFICLTWKKTDWKGFVIGGIEKGESKEEAVRREILEETGYTNIKEITFFPLIMHSKFFQILKQVNRFAHFYPALVTLQDEKRVPLSEEEKNLHDISWIKQEDVLEFLNVHDMKEIWKETILK